MTTEKPHTQLFEPISIRNMELKNRMVMAPMAILASDREGYPTRQMMDYYGERAKGGVGMIIVGAHWILREYAFPYRGCIGDDCYIEKQREFVDAIHAHDCKAALQLHHLGVTSSMYTALLEDPDSYDVIGASAIPFAPSGVTPRELSVEDIRYFVEAYGEAARRAREAGYDAVEIHGAHGYLISQFLSPLTNRRTDDYGGSVEKRARFALEVIRRVREKVGQDYPILMKINAEDGIEYGKQLADTEMQAPMFAEAGVDALDVSVGVSAIVSPIPNLDPASDRIRLAAAVRKAAGIPVIAVGRLGNPDLAEDAIRDGKTDLVAFGRQMLADPEFPNKVKFGRLDEIMYCLVCNNCTERVRGENDSRGVRCTVNAALLREGNFQLEPAATPKKVLVIGGGVAGMQAAALLARRGHEVMLHEKSDRLGGQWNIAAQQEFKMQYGFLVDRLSSELNASGATIVMQSAVTPAMVSDLAPDAVVMATGANPYWLDVPGARGKNVVHAYDVIEGKAEVGERVVVIGGRLVGMEVSLSLAESGKKVSIVTLKRLGENGHPMNANIYLKLRDQLLDNDVRFFPHSPVREITDLGVLVVSGKELIFLKADTVVMAAGSVPENSLAGEIRSQIPEFHMIGDCVEVRKIIDATNEAAEVARMI